MNDSLEAQLRKTRKTIELLKGDVDQLRDECAGWERAASAAADQVDDLIYLFNDLGVDVTAIPKCGAELRSLIREIRDGADAYLKRLP